MAIGTAGSVMSIRRLRMNHAKQVLLDRIAVSEIEVAMIELKEIPQPQSMTFCGNIYYCGKARPDCLSEGYHKCYYAPFNRLVW